MRRTFCEAYLKAMGESASEQDVDDLLVDASVASCIDVMKFQESGPRAIQLLTETLAAILASKEEQAAVLQEMRSGGWLPPQMKAVFDPQVRKTPSWPRSWANFSLLPLYFHRNAWANLHPLGRPNTFIAPV